MRFIVSVVLALSVGIGAYFGSARAASSAKARPRTVRHPRIGDIAAVGQAQCRAWTDSRFHPIREAYLQCSGGPLIRATYRVEVLFDGAIYVFKRGVSGPVYSGP
jgi:hypothetical protein